jgi:hypothetical protein
MLGRYFEVLVLRAGPGVVNLGTLLLIGGWLSPADYGFYSTVLATTGFVASVFFGPLTNGVISQYSKMQARGLQSEYEASLVSSVLLQGLIAAGVGLGLAAAGFIDLSWIGPVVAFGIYTAVQEILHARLKFLAFGMVALVQAITFMSLAWLVVRTTPQPSVALTAFTVSYFVAAVLSMCVSGALRIRWPDVALLKSTLLVGAPYTSGTVAEQGLYLGVRYVIRFFGTAEQLGIFSFCVDLAQRSIGFLINAASFSFVPLAFKVEVEGGLKAFKRVLVSGAWTSILLSSCTLVGVLLIREMGVLSALSGPLLDPVVFGIVSVAVVVNRIKKLILDPIAMRSQKAFAVMAGYAFSVPLTLSASWFVVSVRATGPEIMYLLGYLLAAGVTSFVLRRDIAQS